MDFTSEEAFLFRLFYNSVAKASTTVTNTGSVAGREVVELYFTPPYTNGGIEKASVNLIDFGKTATLEPGANEVVSFKIPLEDMASYDSKGIKTANGGYMMNFMKLLLRTSISTTMNAIRKTWLYDASRIFTIQK